MFFELHSGLPREGPGDDATTRRVFNSLTWLPQRPRILDIGCGPGAQTLVLARESGGTVRAVDSHQAFLDELQRRSQTAGLADAIVPVRASMTELPFEPEAFDLIWSEGAIFVMGFDAGLASWRKFLPDGGTLVVSELTWLSARVPGEARAFWARSYPQMRTIPENQHAIEGGGYENITVTPLPLESWFSEYLDPLEQRIGVLAARRARDEGWRGFLAGEREEIDIVRRYGECFGYVFYVMRKRAGAPA